MWMNLAVGGFSYPSLHLTYKTFRILGVDMNITKDTAEQFLAAINDYLSNGDIVIDAISTEDAGNMYRKEMDDFLLELFSEVIKLKEQL